MTFSLVFLCLDQEIEEKEMMLWTNMKILRFLKIFSMMKISRCQKKLSLVLLSYFRVLLITTKMC
ncbi:hypothetical protein B4U78_015900 [Microbacterium esteraromaticum]|nr:hypothetical protein B4U78_015900 [Microbacterium esteraromaticum]